MPSETCSVGAVVGERERERETQRERERESKRERGRERGGGVKQSDLDDNRLPDEL